MKKIAAIFLVALSTIFAGCTRIETGEVGLRIGFDKQIKSDELTPGSLNQTLIGDVLTFPVKDVAVDVANLTPLAKDNSTMKDFDATVIYSINPKSVSELWTEKAKSFHVEHKGDTFLMFNYVHQTARNAAYKAARDYEALEMNDKRTDIELKMKELITKTFADEGLGSAISIVQVQVRSIMPADAVVHSANELVRAKNELKQREVEVKTAEAEARRMAALANQSSSSIAYMNAQAALNISEGVKNGKVTTIIVPSNFTALMGK